MKQRPRQRRKRRTAYHVVVRRPKRRKPGRAMGAGDSCSPPREARSLACASAAAVCAAVQGTVRRWWCHRCV